MYKITTWRQITVFLSKKDVVKQRLVAAIATGKYPPGTSLRQNAIADEFAFSSTPVREAFADLCASGLLVHADHRGFRVVELDESRVTEVYQARRIVEVAAARLAAGNLTEDAQRALDQAFDELRRLRERQDLPGMIVANERLQRTLYKLCGNRFLFTAIEQLWNSIPRYLPWVLEQRQDDSLVEHRAILAALAVQDEDALGDAVARHLRNAERTFVEYLRTATPAAGHKH